MPIAQQFISPDGKHSVVFTELGEIHFGPPYFSLSVDGVELRGRIFGDKLAWSDDGRYAATEEWLTTDYLKGPITRLLIIDTEAGVNAGLDRIDKGFVEKIVFSGAMLSYTRAFHGTHAEVQETVSLPDIENWVTLDKQPVVTSDPARHNDPPTTT
jgi:hypothetical protein